MLAGILHRTVLEIEVAEPALEGQPEGGFRPAHR
jgi:hypothetical protein